MKKSQNETGCQEEGKDIEIQNGRKEVYTIYLLIGGSRAIQNRKFLACKSTAGSLKPVGWIPAIWVLISPPGHWRSQVSLSVERFSDHHVLSHS